MSEIYTAELIISEIGRGDRDRLIIEDFFM